MNKFILRLADITFSFFGIITLFPLFLFVLLIGFFDTGSPLFLQKRVGRHQKIFTLVKFRTMKVGTKSVASHLASRDSITKFGSFLRKTKLDELPQLWNVFWGQMSLVGPRPCLENQQELIAQRDQLNVFDSRPGITGLAQISGIDMSTPELLARTDNEMLQSLNLWKYFLYILKTLKGRGQGDRVT